MRLSNELETKLAATNHPASIRHNNDLYMGNMVLSGAVHLVRQNRTVRSIHANRHFAARCHNRRPASHFTAQKIKAKSSTSKLLE